MYPIENRKKYSTFAAAFLTGTALITPAAAQDPEHTGIEQVVVTASRTGLKPAQIGSAVTVIGVPELKAGQISIVKDILQDLPGIQISTERPGGFSNVSIRGSDNDQVLVLLDGIELGDPSSTSTQFQFDHLGSGDIERIEVLRGNQSSLYGSDAIGGVINIITKRADEDGIILNAEGEAGSYGTVNGNASVIGRTGGIDYRVSAYSKHADGPSLADPDAGPADEDDAYDNWGMSGRVGAQITPQISAHVMGFFSRTETDLDGTGQDATSSPLVEKDEEGIAAQINLDLLESRWKTDLTYGYYQAERLYFGTFNLPEGDLYRGEKTNINLQSSFRVSDMISLAAGFDLEEESTNQITSFSGNFVEQIDTDSFFGEIALTPTDNLTLTGAVRVDDNSRFGSFDTYRVTAAYFLDQAVAGGNVKLRASYGTGAKAPGLYQLFDPTYGNLALEVETSKGWDAGVEFDWPDTHTHAEITYFHNKVTDEIDFDFAQGGYIQDLGSLTRTRGIEVAFGTLFTKWLGYTQTYTYLDADNLDAGTWMGRPRHSGTAALNVYPTDDSSLTLRARYRSKNESSGPTQVAKGFVTFDLLGSYRISDQVEFYGRVVNVFDKDYQLSWGRSTYNLSAFAGVRISFDAGGFGG